MTLRQLLELIAKLAEDNGLSTPLICGGTPRDRVLGRITGLDDLDLTTGDATVHRLGKLVHDSIPGSFLKTYPDTHSQLMIGSYKIDFSSNFKVSNIDNILKQKKISPTPMKAEIFSRDFTCNALLLDFDLKNLQDPTGQGLKDIEDKIIRCCLDASSTLSVDPKRIIRIVYLAAKLGFDVDGKIIDWVRKNPSAVSLPKVKYLNKKISAALAADTEATLYWLDQLQCWKHLPVLPQLTPYMKAGRI